MYLEYMDTNELDQRFSSGIDYNQESTPLDTESINRAIKELPKEEREVFKLISKGVPQKLIGLMLKVDRSKVSLRKTRIISKLKYLIHLPDVDWRFVDQKIADISIIHWECAVRYREHKNYREVARRTSTPETTVRRKIKQLPDMLINIGECDASTYYTMLIKKPNLLLKRN